MKALRRAILSMSVLHWLLGAHLTAAAMTWVYTRQPLLALALVPTLVLCVRALWRGRLSRLAALYRKEAEDRRQRLADALQRHGTDISSVAVLVHGTAGRSNDWPRLKARLVKELPSPLLVEDFKWSGSNRMLSRARDTAKLEAYLSDVAGLFPKARIHIVAHSHGGNLAVRAATEGLLPRIATIVCLATPFLIVEKRRSSELAILSMVMAVMLTLIAVGIGALQLSFLIRLPLEPTWLLVLVRYAVGICAAAWAARSAWRFAERLFSRVDRAAEALQYDHQRSLPLYIVRSPGDEATVLLTFLQATCMLPEYLLNILAAAERRGRRWQRRHRRRGMPLIGDGWIGGYVALVVLVISWGYVLHETPPAGWWYVFYAALAPLALLVGSAAMLLGLALLAGLLTVGSTVPMVLFGGVAMAAAALTKRITIEAAPPGLSTIIQLPTPARARLFRLRHSAAHQDLIAVRQTCKVIRAAEARDRVALISQTA
jgi:pimeloyl-ACP methyl ester carboxylesterase